MKINFKLALIFLELSLVPLLFVSFVAYSNSEKELTSQIAQNFEVFADIQKSKVETIMTKKIEKLNDINNLHELKEELANYNATNDPQTQQKIKDLLREIQKYNSFHEIHLITPQGEIVASGVINNAHTHPPHKDLFSTSQSENSFFAHVDENKEPVIHMSGPIFLENQLLGITYITFGTEQFFSLFKKDLGFISSEHWELVLRIKNNDPILIAVSPAEHLLEPHAAIQQNSLNQHFLTVQRSLSMNGIEWEITGKLARDEAFLPILRLKQLLVFIVSISFIIIAIISFSITRSLSIPVLSMIQAAKKIARGDLSQRVVYHSQTELGELAKSFNIMASKLKHSQEILEDKVRERTMELTQKIAELEQLNDEIFGKDLHMMELKQKIENLKSKKKRGRKK